MSNPIRSQTEISPVRLVSNANIAGTYFNGSLGNGIGATFTLTSNTLTIDSVPVVLGDSILLAQQSLGYQNGIYQVTTLSPIFPCVLTRRPDFQCIEQLSAGQIIPVSAGTEYGGSVWTVVEPLPQRIGYSATNSSLNTINIVTQSGGGGGGGISGSGTAGEPAFFTDSTTLNSRSSVGFILGAPASGKTLYCFGDSIVKGYGVSEPQRYTQLLATEYGLTENNVAVIADAVLNSAAQVFNNYTLPNNDNPVIYGFGFNDIQLTTLGSTTNAAFYQIRNCYQEQVLYLLLPGIVGANAATKTGTWQNEIAYSTFTQQLNLSMNASDTIGTTVHGRYVGMSLCSNENGAGYYFSLYIDGVLVNPAFDSAPGNQMYINDTSTFNESGAVNYNQLVVYDTGVLTPGTSHTVQWEFISNIGGASYPTINYFFGFDPVGTSGAYALSSAPITLIAPEQFDFINGQNGTLIAQITMRDIITRTVLMFRKRFGANIVFVESDFFTIGAKTADSIHPNAIRHQNIANEISNIWINGEEPVIGGFIL